MLVGSGMHDGSAVRRLRRNPVRCRIVGLVLCGVVVGAYPAAADKIKNGTAVFSGLDKITGRIISFKAGMGETVQFGSLQVTARACFTRPATEAPQTDTFVEVDEVSAKKDFKRIFSGWMFAASPGLHGIEHPIYDIWLTGCESPGETIVDAPQTADTEADAPPVAGSAPAAVPAPPVEEAPKPRPKRVVRVTPPTPVQPTEPVAERREPTQRFFPASQYPSDFGGRDPRRQRQSLTRLEERQHVAAGHRLAAPGLGVAPARNRLGQALAVRRPRDLDGPEGREMRRHELRIEERVAAAPEPRRQVEEADLRRVATPVEHAFAEEGRAECHPVERTHQAVVLIGFDRNGHGPSQTALRRGWRMRSLIQVCGRSGATAAQPAITASKSRSTTTV